MKKIMFFLIGILFAVFCMSCGKKDVGKYTSEELTVKIEEILSKPRFTEAEWKELDMLLSLANTRDCEYTDNLNHSKSYKPQIRRQHRDKAVQTKNWRLLELLARNRLLWCAYYVNQLKNLNYSDEDILKLFTLPNQEIDYTLVVKFQNVELLKLFIPRLPEKERNFFKNRFWEDEEVKLGKDNPFLLQGVYRAGLIDDDKALLECERHFLVENTDFFNELLRRKRQSSKVWTLY